MKLHLFGDSVFQGAVTDIFDNRAESLAELQSPAAIINLVTGRPFAELAGQTLFPHNVERGEKEVTRAFHARRIRPGDAIAFLDVGPHGMDLARHEADWLRLRRAAAGEHDVRLIMCSGFDNGGRGLPQLLHEAPLGDRSPNDAVRAAALAPGEFAGTTAFLDIAGPLKRLHARISARYGRSPYLSDEVHLTAWGQIFLALLLLRALAVDMPRTDALARTVADNWNALGAASRLRALEILEAVLDEAGVDHAGVTWRLRRMRLRRAINAGGRLLLRRDGSAKALAAEVEALIAEAEARYAAGQGPEALRLFGEAAARDPASLPAQQGRLKAAVLAGRHGEVIAAGRAALLLEPTSGKTYVWMAEAMLAEGAGADLVAWLDGMAESHAPRRAAPVLADLNRAFGDPARAEVWAERAAGRSRR